MRVLIPTDGSEFSEAAVNSVAKREWSDGTEIKVLCVLEPLSCLIDPALIMYESKMLEEVEALQIECSRTAKQKLENQLPNCTVTECLTTGNVRDEIIKMAQSWKPDLIVMGSHGRKGFEKFLLGSVAEAVLASSNCSVEIVKIPDKGKTAATAGKTEAAAFSA